VGILVGEGSILEANTADNNGGFGMQTGGGTVIRGNSVAFNGASVGIGGINAFGGSTIVHNAVYRNRGVGLNLDPDGGYGDNVLTLNNNGADNPQVAGGLQIGTNVCGTNTTCP
jgi:hypothetical protein